METDKKIMTTELSVAVGVLAALGVTYYVSTNEPETASEPENAAPVFTEKQKQDFFDAGADGLFDNTNEAISYGLLSEAQAGQIDAAAQIIIDNQPEELLDALIEANGGDRLPYGFGRFVPHEITSTFTDYISPQLNAFNDAVSGRDGCFTKFEQPEAVDDAINNRRAHMPAGVSDMECGNGTEVNLIGYPADAADVRVSYNFEHAAAYFEKAGYYARQNCDDANDCFSAIPFKALDESEGFAQAFADKAQAEAYMTEIQTQAQARFAEIWPQIEDDIATATAAATSAPAPR